MQMPSLESRVASLEAVQAQINERLGNIEQGQHELSNRIEHGRGELSNRIDSNFKWIVGLLITVLLANIGTAITIVLTLNK